MKLIPNFSEHRYPRNEVAGVAKKKCYGRSYSLVDGTEKTGAEGERERERKGGREGRKRACLPIIKFKPTQRKTKRLFSRTGWKLRNANSGGTNVPFVYKTYCPGMIANWVGG